MRRILITILALLGLVAMSSAIASATVWKPSGTVTTTFKPRVGTSVVMTDPGVLQAPAAKVKVMVTVGSGGPVVAAIGRDSDVVAWAAGATVERITGFATDQTFSSKLGQVSGADSSPSQLSSAGTELAEATSLGVAQNSDLWTSSQVVTDSTTLEWQRQAGRWCLVIAPAGTDAAALAKANLDGLTLAVTWPRAVGAVWLWPGLVVGLVLLIAAAVLLALGRRQSAMKRQGSKPSGTGTADPAEELGPQTSSDAVPTPRPAARPRPPSRFELAETATLAAHNETVPAAELDQTALVEPIEIEPSLRTPAGQSSKLTWQPVEPTAVLQPDAPDWADTAWPLAPAVAPAATQPSSSSPIRPVDETPPTGIVGPATDHSAARQQGPIWPTPRRRPLDSPTGEQPRYETAEQPRLGSGQVARRIVQPTLAERAQAVAIPDSPPVPAAAYQPQPAPDRQVPPADQFAPTMADTQVMGVDDIVEAVRQGRLVGLTRRQIRQAEAMTLRSQAPKPDQSAEDLPVTPERSSDKTGFEATGLTSSTSRSPRPTQSSAEPPAAPPYALRPAGTGLEAPDRAPVPTSAASTRARGFLAAIAAGRLSEAEPAPPESTSQSNPAEPWVAPWLHQSDDPASDQDSEGVER